MPKTITENGIRVYLNYYCKCPCHGRIPWKKSHINKGIPDYIRGHQFSSIESIKLHTTYLNEPTIVENNIEVWKNFYCKHCNERIPVRKNQSRYGIPDLIPGHYAKTSEFRSKMKGNTYGFKKGKKCKNWNGIKKGQHTSSKTEFKKGNKHPYYIDGYGEERKHSRYRGMEFIPLNKRTKEANSPHHIDKELVIFIPRKLHKSFYHSVRNGINIDKMNELAYEYMIEQIEKKNNKEKT